MEKRFKDLIDLFGLKNDLTPNKYIWVGHAKIGFRERMTIEKAIELLKGRFQDYIAPGEETPKELLKTIEQWEEAHPFQRVREHDQPMFLFREGGHVIVAVIWPWHMKEGVASLMVYEGALLA